MAEYSIMQDGGHYTDVKDLNEAIRLAEEFLGAVPEGTQSTFTIETQGGRILASVTNRRIVGRFVKQQWGGPKGDTAITVGEDEFDATDAVLLMEHKRLVELDDDDESSDELGRSHIDWGGPCYVRVVDSVCEYFGVSDTRDITPEALDYARQRTNPQPPTEQVITLTTKLRLRVAPGADVNAFIENLDYAIISNTVGVTVADTEIVDSN